MASRTLEDTVDVAGLVAAESGRRTRWGVAWPEWLTAAAAGEPFVVPAWRVARWVSSRVLASDDRPVVVDERGAWDWLD